MGDGEGAADAQGGESTQERVRLVLKAVESALEPACWPEAPLKRCLRSGGKSGAIPNSECRAAVASVVFGVSMLRARLGYMLAQCTGGAGGSLDVKPLQRCSRSFSFTRITSSQAADPRR